MSPDSNNPQSQPQSLSLLQTLGASASTSQEIYTTQISHRTLTLRPTSPDPHSQTSRSIRRKKRVSARSHARAKQRPRRLSAREKRVLGVYDLEFAGGAESTGLAGQKTAGSTTGCTTGRSTARRRTAADWSVWKGLWRLWVGYVWEVLGETSSNEPSSKPNASSGTRQASALSSQMLPVVLGPKIAALELHGSLLQVVKAECSSLVGIWGVCVRETKFSVVLVDKDCCVRRVGKKGVVFGVEIPLVRAGDVVDLDVFLAGEGPRVVVEISGSALLCRPADRATKKFKGRKFDGL